LLTVSEQKSGKINRLLQQLGDADLVSARWLRAHGYSSSLVARYVGSGWLESPARGVYTRRGGTVFWDGVLNSMQRLEGLALHAGGRFALAWHGHEHYLRLGEAATITLYGEDRVPSWVGKLPLTERFEYRGRGPFDLPRLQFDTPPTDATLYVHGLERQSDSSMVEVVLATIERAVLELCDEKPSAALVYEVDAVMKGMPGLRPELVNRLLRRCCSVKAKRLFLALAERHAHPWMSRITLDGVDLGSGKRVLVAGGRLHPKYHITLPENLDEQLG
jgi:hypothetical protein